MKDSKIGECAKHPGNSMIDCPACSMEESKNDIKLHTKESWKLLQSEKEASALKYEISKLESQNKELREKLNYIVDMNGIEILDGMETDSNK